MPDAIARVSEISERLIATSELINNEMKSVIRQLQEILVNSDEEGRLDGDVK